MLDLWLVRHAESIGNVDGSESDTDLSPQGVAQAGALGRCLAAIEFETVWVSPLLRARRTAAIALPAASPIADPRLAELRAGPSVQFLDASDPAAVAALLSAPAPDVESGRDFMERVRSWWRADLPETGRVIAFTHVAVIREVLGGILGYRRAPQRVRQAALFRLSVVPTNPSVTLWDSVDHLR